MESTPARITADRADFISNVAVWILSCVLAAGFVWFGGIKLLSTPAMVHEFVEIGAGQWLRYVTGVLEFSAAIGVLIPRIRLLAALQLAAVMTGATIVNIAVLRVGTWRLTVTLLIMALVLAWLCRNGRSER